MNNKKAQSISINTIVIAAIALVVMLLLVMIFTANMGGWRRGTSSCESNGGWCVDKEAYNNGEVCNGDYEKLGNYDCFLEDGKEDTTKVCCVGV